jgi:uncharacterized protein involved in exopolysaccharide biosynthesis
MGEQIEGVSLAAVLKGIAQRKLLIAIATALGVLAGLAVLVIFKPSYQSESQVIIENLQTPFEKANTQQPELRADVIDKTIVLSQVSVLKSDDIGSRVVDKLDLAHNPEFNPLLRGISFSKKLLITLGFLDDPNLFTPKELALKSLEQHLTVYQVPDSNVIGIKFSAGSKQIASDVANSIAEIYVTSTREVGTSSNGRAKDWLAQQITDLRTKVAASESAVETYRSESGLIKGERATLSTQQISELNSQIVVAQSAASEAQARVTEIKSMLASGNIDASSDVLNSPLIQNLKQSQVAAQRRLSELAATYLPNHPKMVAAQADLTNVNNQLRREALKIVESLQSQAKVANSRAASLKADLDRLKGQEANNNISDVKLQELQRNADADRKLLENLLERYADVSSRQDMNLQPGMARIIQTALPAPAPYFPKTGPIMILTTLAGLIMGMGLAFLAEVISASDPSKLNARTTVGGHTHPAYQALEQGTEIPNLRVEKVVAQSAPVVKPEPTPEPLVTPAVDVHPAKQEISPPLQVVTNQYQAPKPAPQESLLEHGEFPAADTATACLAMLEQAAVDGRSSLAEGAKSLGSIVLALKAERGFKSFSVLSLGSAAPNSAMAVVATARALAATKTKVIAIDLGPSGPAGFDMLFGLPAGMGVVDLLGGNADFTKVVVRDPHSQAHVMRFSSKAGPEALSQVQARMGQILEALSSIYGVILLHLGEATTTTPASAALSDAAVILATQARQKDGIAAAQILEAKGVKITVNMRLDSKLTVNEVPLRANS